MAEEAKSTGPVRMVPIENMVENIRYKSQILARTNKIDSAVICSRHSRLYRRVAHGTDPDHTAGITGGMR